jgi:hypothetical protein
MMQAHGCDTLKVSVGNFTIEALCSGEKGPGWAHPE